MKTVSRVLNNEAHVRPALREQVMRAVAELGYRPNLAARQLAANRSFLIAFIMRDITVSYYSQIVVAAATECRRHGYHLVSETFDESETGKVVVERVVAHLRPDGIILAPPLCNDYEVLAAVERTGVPLARIAGATNGYGAAVTVHEGGASRDLVRHLIALGHRRIALIAPPEGHGAAQERRTGYREALDEAGIAFDPAIVLNGDFSFASGARTMEQLMRLPDRPTAVFAGNDGMALGALAIAHRDGLAVPGDVAIAGFDDSPASRMVFPPLTTVRQPFAGMARAAVAAILNHDSATVPLAHELVLRGSTTGSLEMDLSALDA
jgi:LacI family transcriptional regulator